MVFWKRIYGIAAPFRFMLAASFAMTIVAQVIGFLPMLAQKAFFDVVGEWMRGTETSDRTFVVIVVALVGSNALGEIVGQMSNYAADLLQARMSSRFNGSTIRHLLWLSLGYHTRHDTAEKTHVVVKGTEGVRQVIWLSLAQFVPAVCMVAVYTVWSCLVAPLPGMVMIVGALLVFSYALAVGKRIRGLRREYRDSDRAAEVYASGILLNIRSVKATATEQTVLEEIMRRNETIRLFSDRLSGQFLRVGSVQTLMRHAVGFVVLGFTVWQMLRGDATLGTATLMFGATQRVIGMVDTALRSFNAIERARPEAEMLFQLLDVRPDVLPPANPISLGRMLGSISFDRVSFAYPETAGTIHDVSLYVPAGKTVAIVGESGAGKTTLATLLLRGFDPHDGCIRIDGKDLRELDPVEYLSQVGTVAQGVGLFSTSVRENIAFGVEHATKEAVENAAKVAGAHEFILRLPNGYDTQVGEGGVNLSGGQAQRICIARALLRDPRLLILDEATSHLDVKIEAQIMEEIIRRINGTRTVFIIAHRLSTIRNADIVIVLDQGRIVQQGPYDQVRNEPGPFARMVELQLENARL